MPMKTEFIDLTGSRLRNPGLGRLQAGEMCQRVHQHVARAEEA